MKEKYINLILPMPISINKAYCNSKKGRTKSDEYEGWEKLAFVELKKQETYTIKWDEWLFVEYEFNFSLYTEDWEKIIKDVANYEKVLSDFLANYIVWFKDHKIKTILLKKVDNRSSFVKVKIKETV